MANPLPPPAGDASLLVRSDFTNDDAWAEVCAAADADVCINPEVPFHARLIFLDNPEYEGVSPDEVAALAADAPGHRVVFVVDSVTISDPERPILAVDTDESPGATIRVVPSKVWLIENNVNEANVWFSEYLDRALGNVDGILR